MKEEVHFDEFGEEYVLDEMGNKRPPMQTTKISKDGSFLHYESEKHCGLCGRLDCRGNCFR